jgi:hypothetical protein
MMVDDKVNTEKPNWSLLAKLGCSFVFIYIILTGFFMPLSDSEEYIRCQYEPRKSGLALNYIPFSERSKYRICQPYPFSVVFFRRINLLHRIETDAVQAKRDKEIRGNIERRQRRQERLNPPSKGNPYGISIGGQRVGGLKSPAQK